MSDIVERLRADPQRNFAEAADEIERLRSGVALLDRIRANPFSAIDKILAAVDVDTPAKWSAQVDEALGE